MIKNNRLDDVANAIIEPNVSGGCTFCESDEHGFKECDQKAQCINCGLDNHKADKCSWVGNNKMWSSRTCQQAPPSYGS